MQNGARLVLGEDLQFSAFHFRRLQRRDGAASDKLEVDRMRKCAVQKAMHVANRARREGRSFGDARCPSIRGAIVHRAPVAQQFRIERLELVRPQLLQPHVAERRPHVKPRQFPISLDRLRADALCGRVAFPAVEEVAERHFLRIHVVAVLGGGDQVGELLLGLALAAPEAVIADSPAAGERIGADIILQLPRIGARRRTCPVISMAPLSLWRRLAGRCGQGKGGQGEGQRDKAQRVRKLLPERAGGRPLASAASGPSS